MPISAGSCIQGLSLDFFGTLVTVDEDRPSMATVLTSLGFRCTDSMESIWNTHGFDGQETPTHSSEPDYLTWRRTNLARLAASSGVPTHLIGAVVENLEENDLSWTVKAKPGAAELLTFLTTHGIPATICSNWDYGLSPYLRQAGLPDEFPRVISSFVGVRKPATRIFGEVARQLTLPPHAILHVGDSAEADVIGALRAGMQSGYLRSERSTLTLPSTLVEVFPSLYSVLDFLRVRLSLY
ncbi:MULTISPECIES: HAD family hydrolase [unclassified Streptomyces]|uniref:HAD family hydrolase n=1 Tax=unclassified Streptomyces TaxID=2593676 RepID=UPI0036651D3F